MRVVIIWWSLEIVTMIVLCEFVVVVLVSHKITHSRTPTHTLDGNHSVRVYSLLLHTTCLLKNSQITHFPSRITRFFIAFCFLHSPKLIASFCVSITSSHFLLFKFHPLISPPFLSISSIPSSSLRFMRWS